MKYRFRFGEPDRETYGDGWYEGDLSAIDWDREGMTGLVERFETETGYALMVPVDLYAGLARKFHRPFRAVMWWAVLLAGHEVKFDDFQPRIDLAEGGNQGNSQGPTKRAAQKATKFTGTAGRTTAKRSASSSRTTS